MVDVQPSNEKLIHRAKQIIRMITDAAEAVQQAYMDSGGHVKTAIVMILRVDRASAQQLLQQSNRFVHQALVTALGEKHPREIRGGISNGNSLGKSE